MKMQAPHGSNSEAWVSALAANAVEITPNESRGDIHGDVEPRQLESIDSLTIAL